jgi:hypothetical protein
VWLFLNFFLLKGFFMERLDPIPTIASPVHPLPDPRERVSFRVTGPLVDPPRAGIDWNNVLDAGLFVTLLVVGSVLLYFREELKLLVFGEIFLNAGVRGFFFVSSEKELRDCFRCRL